MHSKRKKRALVAGLLAIGAVVAVSGAASANLAGSSFEGNDGNLVPGSGTDWTTPAPNRVIGTEVITGTGDSSLGQGSSENDSTVTVGFGSIPNSKANLSQFLIGSEQAANGHTYLYLGWTRANSGGTTNFDFEINKLAQPDMTTAGSKVLNRTAGDLLVNYLFQGTIGRDTPTVEIRTWTGTAWSNPTTGVVAEAGINATAVANPFGTPNPLPIGQFGETSIDLTASGIIPADSCKGFSSAYVKSRSSTSFTSELKDFVPPQHVNIATCASITVDKVTVPAGSAQSFHFNASYNAAGFDLTDTATPNESGDLNAGTYSVSEDLVPNWVLSSATCDDGSPITAIVLSANEHVTCTFTNTLQLGAIQVTKTHKHAADGPGDHPQAGVTFTVAGKTVVTDANGQACVDGLAFGSYDAVETVPAGYVADGATTKSVTVDNTAKCSDSPFGGESVAFGNTPLTNVSISVDSQVPGGTSSTISCDDGSSAAAGDDISLNITDAQPKTLVCTIVIDP